MSAGLLHPPITAWVERSPDATAVVMGEELLTYAELDALADRLAAALIERGCQSGDRVCLLAPKSPVTIAAMVATLRAGCVYVPVDVTGPVTRSAQIVASAQPAGSFVLTGGHALLDSLISLGAVESDLPSVDLDPGRAFLDEGATSRLGDVETAPSDAAHVLFTSGSTGQPKGVVVTHASARAYIDWAIDHFDIRSGDRCSGHPPLHFDLSTFDVFATLAAGGELHLLPPNVLLPRQLAEYIRDSELDQLFCVPSALAYLSAHGAVPDGGFPTLRRVLCCGEVLPTPVLIDWMSRHPRARFTNLYGPTETTIASSYHDIVAVPSDSSQPIPIGTACVGEEMFVLGEDGQPTADGDVGELCIAGVGLSPGYWRDPEMTAQAFIPDPRSGRAGGRVYHTGDLARRDTDGVMFFVGRRDTQIKHRGYRIELGEIEAAIRALPAVAECAVVAVSTDGFEGSVICCAAALRSPECDTTPTELRVALAKRLPRYMVPGRWQLMNVLPKNVNGKIDRRKIRAQFETSLVVR